MPKAIITNACNFSEKALTLILGYLPGVAVDERYGKIVVLMFSHPDEYCNYILYFST